MGAVPAVIEQVGVENAVRMNPWAQKLADGAHSPIPSSLTRSQTQDRFARCCCSSLRAREVNWLTIGHGRSLLSPVSGPDLSSHRKHLLILFKIKGGGGY